MLTISRLEVKAISAQNLSIDAGDCVSLSGASGMGKSLFLKAMADLVINKAELHLGGQGREDMSAPEWRRQVTYVGPKSAWWHDHVMDHFQDREWLEGVLPCVDLSPKVVGWPVSRLSSGEAQRLVLLRALEDIEEGVVRYLLLDEPTSALDGGRQAMVEDLLKSYLQSGNVGILFVSHDDRQVERFATKNWQIYDRRVQEVDQ